MKKVLGLLAVTLTLGGALFAQEKKKPASPLDSVSATIKGGAAVSIVYSRPSVKGRTIGKDLEPMPGKVWRAGANGATTFEVSKDVKVEGKALPAGKYAFFTIHNGAEWTLIFNKVYKTWGAYDYEKNKAEDALQVTVKDKKAPSFTETLTYTIDAKGDVTLLWGDHAVNFKVKG
ncbi:hypothetical protein HNQ91_001550 [Filimonas zeae]|uniref:DUF2911 domain-containing protein n=1 Tax=Filimonas zeae TaxID=1737353 RepID=A0A917MY02_9BACT|nr:DUF2911 domain-containing protein [Filimonas zeae]MDR6338499.1 hypothetical protein [Filimonas zeae]GGH67971.1 hypothetical protein GCM10011379_23780 [Filimonas zeae]